MPIFVELRDGQTSLDRPSGRPMQLGPVLGPFVGARLLRDEVRVATAKREYALPRIADGVCYGGSLYGDVEIIAAEQIGNGRARRMKPFDAALAAIPSEPI